MILVLLGVLDWFRGFVVGWLFMWFGGVVWVVWARFSGWFCVVCGSAGCNCLTWMVFSYFGIC